MLRARLTTVALLLALAWSPGAGSAASAKLAGTPIVVGAILSITGLYAPLGEPERNALKLAEADINAHGGIGGRPLEIRIVDDEGKADTATQLATSFIGDHVAAIIGGSLTPTSLAIARTTAAAKVFQIYMTPTSSVWNQKSGIALDVFEATPRNELEAAKLLTFAKKKLGTNKMAVLHDDAPYGTAGSAIVAEAAKALDLVLADDEAFPITSTDLTAQLGKIKSSGADTIVIWTASPAAAIAVRQIRQLGLKLHVVGSTGIVSDNFLKISGADGDGVYADMTLDVTHPNASQRKFLDAYRAAYHVRPSNFASFAWDAAQLAARALAKTGGVGGDQAAAALLSLPPFTGSTATFKFSSTDHNGIKATDIHIAVDKNAVWFTL